jgi:hypothetical protein
VQTSVYGACQLCIPSAEALHWSEKEFDRELMTGYSESSMPLPLSRLTIAAMKDLGYQVNFGAAEAFTLLLAGAEDTVRLAGVEEQTMIL